MHRASFLAPISHLKLITNYDLVRAGILLCLGLGCGACQTATTTIHINNRSSATLENVTLSGNGFRQAISTIQPKSSTQTQVCPQGETDLLISFKANGKTLESPQNTYFECGGYRVTVDVDPSLQISTRSAIK